MITLIILLWLVGAVVTVVWLLIADDDKFSEIDIGTLIMVIIAWPACLFLLVLIGVFGKRRLSYQPFKRRAK